MSATNDPQPREGGPYEHATSAPTKRLTREEIKKLHEIAREWEGAGGDTDVTTYSYPHETVLALLDRIEELEEGLRVCEENLRLVHEAAGPVEKSAPMPSHSTFEAWKIARALLGPDHG